MSKRVTVNNLIEILARIDRAENMAQVCWIYDSLDEEVTRLIQEARDRVGCGEKVV